LGLGERLIMQVGFKDRALPAKAVLAVISKADVMDGKVEVDRRANTPEALLAALKQREAELEELRARYAGNGPASLALSEWLNEETVPVHLYVEAATADASGLKVLRAVGYEGQFSALVAIRVLKPHGQKSWVPSQASITSATGTPVKVISVQMRFLEPPPGKEGLVVVETGTPPWTAGKFKVELVDASSARRLSFDLRTK
jgi:uncharacterized protein (TIGR02268 family)